MGSESRSSIELLPAVATQRSSAFLGHGKVGFVLVLSTVLAAAALYSASLDSLLRAWSDTTSHTYTHGLLIVAISSALLVRRWRELGAMAPTANGLGVVLLIVSAFLWLVGLRASIQIVHQLAWPLILWSAVLGIAGWGIARLCLFPLAYLYFAVPFWDHGNDLLQGLSVFAVRGLLRATSVPAYFEGELIEIPAGTFHIEDGCSGLHFFIVALALGCLYGEVNRCSPSQRVKLAALAAVCALLSNWLRIYTIIVAGHLTQMQHYLVRVDHYYFGWGVFAVAMACFFALSVRWLPPLNVRLGCERAAPADSSPKHDIGLRVMLVVGLCAAPAWSLIAQRFPLPEIVIRAPHANGWSGPTMLESDGRYASADARLQVRYVRADRWVELTIAGFREQGTGKKISGYGAQPLGRGETAVTSRSHTTVAGQQYVETEVHLPSGASMLSWTQYRVGARPFVSPAAAQFAYGLKSLATMPPVRVLELRTPCAPDCRSARSSLHDFAHELAQ